MKRVVMFMLVVGVLAVSVCVLKYGCCLAVIEGSVERVGASSKVKYNDGRKELLLELDAKRVCKIKELLGTASPLFFSAVKSVCLGRLDFLDKNGNINEEVGVFRSNVVKIDGCYFILSSDLVSLITHAGR